MRLFAGWRLLLAASFFISAAPFHLGASAQEAASPVPELGGVALSPLNFGELLLQEGRLDDAAAFLQSAQPSTATDKARRAYLLGLIARERGDEAAAIGLLEDALSSDPGFSPARLMLADLYVGSGERQKADYHLTVLLRDTRLDTETTGTIDAALDRLRDSERLSFSISAALLPQSNVTKRAQLDTVVIDERALELSDDAQAQSGFGGFVAAGVTYQPVLADHWRGRFSATGSARIFENDALNEIRIGGEAGALRLLPDGSLRAGLRASRLFSGGEGFRWEVGPVIGWQRDFSPRSRLSLNLGVERRVHDEASFRDGYRFSARAIGSHALDISTLLTLNASAEYIDARALDESGPRLGFGGAVTHGFDGGLVVTGGLDFTLDRRSGDDAFFDERRKDVLIAATASVLHRRVRYAGFAPFLEYGFERNVSTIPFYDFVNHRLGVGVTRRF